MREDDEFVQRSRVQGDPPPSPTPAVPPTSPSSSLTPRELPRPLRSRSDTPSQKFSTLKEALEFAGLGASAEEVATCRAAFSERGFWGGSVVTEATRGDPTARQVEPSCARRASLDLGERDLTPVATTQQVMATEPAAGGQREGGSQGPGPLAGASAGGSGRSPSRDGNPPVMMLSSASESAGGGDAAVDKDIVAGSLPPDDLARSKSALQSSRGISEGVKTEFDSGPFQKRELPESPSRMTGALRDGKILKMLKVEEGDVKQAGRETIINNSTLNKQLELAGLLKVNQRVPVTARTQAAGENASLPSEPETTLPQLSEEQSRALRAAKQGSNLFISGGAGVGKSFVTNLIVQELKKMHKRVQITASTGIAAVNVSGQTIHSFAGVGLGIESKQFLGDKALKSKQTRDRWRSTDVLIIDEISMIKADLFEKVEHVAVVTRTNFGSKNDTVTAAGRRAGPFAGVQVIVVGDFLQLPPVVERGDSRGGAKFAFESKLWDDCGFENILLSKVFRQSDATFVNLLNDLRVGRVTDSAAKLLASTSRPLAAADPIKPTKLYPHRKNVQAENDRNFAKLPGGIVRYEAEDKASSRMALKHLESLNKNLQAYATLETKKDMQVVLLANLNTEEGLCNGSRGIIVEYKDPTEDVISSLLNDQHGGSKDDRQGMRAWMKTQIKLPVVLFANKVLKVIGPHKWDMKVNNGKDTIYRRQIPLAPAWALTIHKCQGMTLDRVVMDLQSVFDDGMAYVALSRARSLEGTQLLGFDARKVTANARVLDFYRKIGMGMLGSSPQQNGATPAPARATHTLPAKAQQSTPCERDTVITLGRPQKAKSDVPSSDDITEDASHMLMITGAVTERYIQKQIGQILSFAGDPDEARAMIALFKTQIEASVQKIFSKCVSEMNGTQ